VVTKTLPKTATDEENNIRKEEDLKARKIIIYSVRDHLLPCISNLKTSYEMYEALKEMFESENTLRALTLKCQLQSTKMTKGDTVAIFFMNISEIKERLEAIGEIMSDRELVLSTLNNTV
jgi:orotate phosphoribosyltransferase-like protein